MLLRHFEELQPLKTLRPVRSLLSLLQWEGWGELCVFWGGSKELKADDGKLSHSYLGFSLQMTKKKCPATFASESKFSLRKTVFFTECVARELRVTARRLSPPSLPSLAAAGT